MAQSREELVRAAVAECDALRVHAPLWAVLDQLRVKSPRVFHCAVLFLLAKLREAEPSEAVTTLRSFLEKGLGKGGADDFARSFDEVHIFVMDFAVKAAVAFERGAKEYSLTLLNDLQLAHSYLLMLSVYGDIAASKLQQVGKAAERALGQCRAVEENLRNQSGATQPLPASLQVLDLLVSHQPEPLSEPPVSSHLGLCRPRSPSRDQGHRRESSWEKNAPTGAFPLQAPVFSSIFPLAQALGGHRRFSDALDLSQLLERGTRAPPASFEKIFANAQSRENVRRFLAELAGNLASDGRLDQLYLNARRLQQQMNA